MRQERMSRLSLFIFLLLLASCSIIIQSSPVENQLHNTSETDNFVEELANLEMTKVDNHGNKSPENSTYEELPTMLEEMMINRTHYPLENENLFEGDLAIPEELIEEYYGSFTRGKRGAVRSNSRLWPSGRVYYRFASAVSSADRNTIRSAISYFQTYTCLRFYYRSSQRNYVEFTTAASECSSDYIGCKGGKQVIRLGPGCRTRGVVLHEIGHAIGFWHEHSRPDRDSYVRIMLQNVQSGMEYAFRKRTYSDVDSHGYSYDYGSIMHYRTTAFSRNEPSLPTIAVINVTAYASQGSPSLGQLIRLSRGDIAQVNRLYDNCPSPGRLRIYARNGRNVPDRDGWWAGDSDPYMVFVAYDLYGGYVVLRTSKVQDNNNPVWNQWLDFGTRVWKKFTVKVWDADIGADDALSNTHTWNVYRGTRLNNWIRWSSTNGRVYFDYYYQ